MTKFKKTILTRPFVFGRYFIFSLLFFIGNFSYAQNADTLPVYFDFGEFNLKQGQIKRLNVIAIFFDANDIDSIYFIGMTDTIGSIEDNQQLAEKRATEVKNYVKKFFPNKTKMVVVSKGESKNGKMEKNRRVDVIFYFTPNIDDAIGSGIDGDVLISCYQRADTILKRAIIKEFQRGKKEFVELKVIMSDSLFKRIFYSARSYQDSPEKLDLYKLKWSKTSLYYYNAKESIYSTKLLKEDFDRFSIFSITLDTLNLSKCCFKSSEYVFSRGAYDEDVYLIDKILMSQSKIRYRSYGRYHVLYRVSKEWVDPDFDYFEGCDTLRKIDFRDIANHRKHNRMKRHLESKSASKVNRAQKKLDKSKYYYWSFKYNPVGINQVVRKFKVCNLENNPSDCRELINPLCFYYDIPCIYLRLQSGYLNFQELNSFFVVGAVNFNIYNHPHYRNRGELKGGALFDGRAYFNFKSTQTLYSMTIFNFATYGGWFGINDIQIPKFLLDFNIVGSHDYILDKFGENFAIPSIQSEIELHRVKVIYPRWSLYASGGVGVNLFSQDFAFSPMANVGFRFNLLK